MLNQTKTFIDVREIVGLLSNRVVFITGRGTDVGKSTHPWNAKDKIPLFVINKNFVGTLQRSKPLSSYFSCHEFLNIISIFPKASNVVGSFLAYCATSKTKFFSLFKFVHNAAYLGMDKQQHKINKTYGKIKESEARLY